MAVEVAAAVEWVHRSHRDRVVAILVLLKDFDLENKAIDHLRRKTLFADSLSLNLPVRRLPFFYCIGVPSDSRMGL